MSAPINGTETSGAPPVAGGAQPASDVVPADDRAALRRRPRRTRAALVGGGVALALAGVGAAAAGIGGGGNEQPAHNTLPPATTEISRDTLVETENVSGSLGYGNARDLPGKASGTITWLPAPGSRIERGRPVYRADEKPVVLLYGPLPMYRPLTTDLTGPDVRQFEQNLWALGYRGFTVDDKYTARTAAAVKSWQKRLGVPTTGTVEPGAVAIAPGAIRVGELKVGVGDPAGGTVLSYTGTTRLITVDLDVRYQQLVKRGARVTVELPGGETARGTVASISPVATVSEGREGSEAKSTVAVVVTVADQRALGSYDKAPVQVELVAGQRKDVLTVPVAALLALAEGGYGVEVVEHGTSRIVRVETGMFSAGKVEVRGEGLDVGTKVGVPA